MTAMMTAITASVARGELIPVQEMIVIVKLATKSMVVIMLSARYVISDTIMASFLVLL